MRTKEEYQDLLDKLEAKIDNYVEDLVENRSTRNPRTEEYIQSYCVARVYLKEKIAEKFLETQFKEVLKAPSTETKNLEELNLEAVGETNV